MLNDSEMADLERRVERGIAWLDEVKPGWRDLIDVSELDMPDANQCICGQVFMEDALKDALAGDGYGYALSIMADALCGGHMGFSFPLTYDNRGISEEVYEYLAYLWIKEIQK